MGRRYRCCSYLNMNLNRVSDQRVLTKFENPKAIKLKKSILYSLFLIVLSSCHFDIKESKNVSDLESIQLKK